MPLPAETRPEPGLANCPAALMTFQSPPTLMPSCFTTLRATSTTLTRSMTWSRPTMVTALMTFPVKPGAPPELPLAAA